MISLPLKNKSAYLLTDRLTRKYITGVDIAEGYFIYSHDCAYFTDARYFSVAKDKLEKAGVTAKLYTGLSDIKEYLKEQKIKTLYINFNTVTVAEYNSYKSLGVKILDGAQILSNSRAVKSKLELGYIEKACEIAQNALNVCIEYLKEGVSENFIKDVIERKLIELGAEGVSFETIVAFGANAAVPHHETGETKLKKGDCVLIDMGCKYNGYCSDITRTLFYGQPSQKFIDCYNAVLTANQWAIENITSGISTRKADDFARGVLKKSGLGEYFTHSLGHGVGLEIHEFPSLSPKSDSTLKDGMVFTIEPGVYLDGEFGIRIEDTVVLLNGKVKRLYTDSKDFVKLD